MERGGDHGWNWDRSGRGEVLGRNLRVPPVNVGVRSTPNYAATFTQAAVHSLGHGRRVFAGQRAESFHVDLGSIFDLGTLRPFEALHLIPSANAVGVNGGQGLNVHSIALQVPFSEVTRHGTDAARRDGSGVGDRGLGQRQPTQVQGSRRRRRALAQLRAVPAGVPAGKPAVQRGHRADGGEGPVERARSAPGRPVRQVRAEAGTGRLLPVLYPGVFPNLAGYTKPRADLQAILLTGIPKGVVPGFQNNTGPVLADLLRLNLAVPASREPQPDRPDRR